MELYVRRSDELKQEELKKVLEKASAKEEKIFRAARNEETYCRIARAELLLFDEEQLVNYFADKGTLAASCNDLTIMDERLDEMVLELESSYERSMSDTCLIHPPAKITHLIHKLQIDYLQRLNREDAEDRRSREAILQMDSRDVVWVKMQQLKHIFLSEWTRFNSDLRLELALVAEKMRKNRPLVWMEKLRRVVCNLSTPKQQLPKKFSQGTVRQLKKILHTTAQVFIERQPYTRASFSTMDLQMKMELLCSSYIAGSTSTRDSGTCSAGIVKGRSATFGLFLSEVSVEMKQRITRFLLQLERSYAETRMLFGSASNSGSACISCGACLIPHHR
ncbi:hypothetical protein R1flu_011604 [Riccia fluitans]|uniref:Uncharacterized protein n=1 Tax=Riccia fluitans TaxID=41844 RepID=A0ABD1ZBJ6_9MARC